MNYLQLEKVARRLLMHYFSWRSMQGKQMMERIAKAQLNGFAEGLNVMGIGGAYSTIIMAVEEEYDKLAPKRESVTNSVEDRAWRDELTEAVIRRLAAMVHDA